MEELRSKKIMKPKVADNDMWILLLSTIRYSMGRRTYMSSLAGELVLRYKDYLKKYQLQQIADEIAKELRLAESLGSTLEMELDHRAWQGNWLKIHEEAISRR